MKKTSRVFLMALLVMAMLATLALPALAADYANVPSWAEGQYKLAVVPDRLDGRNANDKITREEFAAVIYKVFNSGINVTPAPEDTFTDTKDPAVLWAYAAQIIQGVGNGKFNPDALITRQDIAVMCTRAVMKIEISWYKIKDNDKYTLVFESIAPFADENTIADYAKIPVNFMAAMEVIQGRGENLFDPLANATILETGIMLSRILNNFSKITEIVSNTEGI